MKDTANHWYPKVKCRLRVIFVSLKNLPGGKESSDNFLHHNNENLPYYRKLTLHEIKVLQINAT